MPKILGVFFALMGPFIALILVLSLFSAPLDQGVSAVVSTPRLTTSLETEKAARKAILTKFFEKNKSPLAAHTDTFVDVSVKYNLDYRLLPAIACIESSCGKRLIPGSYNPFGWGIYGSNVITFNNYDQAIETVGEGIYKNYISRGFDTPEKIAPIYTPPAHRHWLSSVKFFMNQMDAMNPASL